MERHSLSLSATLRAVGRIGRVFACCLAIAPVGAVAASDPNDRVIVAAKEARDRGSLKDLQVAAVQAGPHVLAVYPAWWRLQADPGRGPDELKRFVDRYREGPLVDLARRERLKLLARAGDWTAFRAGIADVIADDSELTCMRWQDALQSADAGANKASAEAVSLWESERETPSACAPVWAALVARGELPVARIYDRIRILNVTGRLGEARRAAAVLNDGSAMTDANLERTQREASKWLAKGQSINLATRADVELALAAIARMAKQDAEDARVALERFVGRLKPADASFAWATVASFAALQQLPDAKRWFSKMTAEPARLSEHQHAWRVRAALRVQDWSAVRTAIVAMPESDRADAAWRYWLGRAHHELGEREAALALWRPLAETAGYHGLLAAEAMGTNPPLSFDAVTLAEADFKKVMTQPSLVRAVALYRLGWRDEGFREWIWGLRGLRDYELLAAAEFARQQEIPDRAIATALRTTQLTDYAQRFPLHHLAQVNQAAAETGLDPAWIYAIIRQESRFMVDVRSRAGALGLMQLMPATAKYTAAKLGIDPFKTTSLSDPLTNIRLGSAYLQNVYDDLNDRVMAIAAYNAGPGRAKRWRAAKPLPGAIYAETIPFNETRDYVKQVIANHYYYEARLTGRRLSVKQLLGEVPGREAMTTASAR
jgi:soluble lytic murein transglycosylase